MLVREITLEDYNALIDFWKKNYFVNEVDGLTNFKLFLEKNPHLSILAEEEGKIIGTILGSFDGRRGYVQKLVVAKEARGKGIGKQLLDETVKKLHALGAHYIPVACEINNTSFYEKSGFKKTNQVALGYT